MNRHFCSLIAAFVALSLWPPLLAHAQPSGADELNQRAAELYRAGKFAEATLLVQQVLVIRERELGPDDPNVAESLNNLAVLYIRQGHYPEAEPLCKRSLEIYEKALVPDDPNVAGALYTLALLYEEQGRYAEAEPLCKRSLAIYEKALAHDHPLVATALVNLARLYEDQGHYPEAEPLYKRALAIYENAREPDRLDVATALNNLARLYKEQGRYAEAETLYKRSLAIYEKALGPDHSLIAGSLNNLASLYDNQGRYAEAETLCKRSLAIREKALGSDHLDVAQSLNNLAVLYFDQGRYAEAEPLYKRALAIYEKALVPDDPNVAHSLNNLASLYDEQGRYADALPLVRRTIANKTAATQPALPVLFGAQVAKFIAADEAIDDGLNVVQRASQTAAGEALNALAVRFSAGNDRLAALVRKDQDLAGEVANLDRALIAAFASDPSKRDAAAEQQIRDHISAVAKERADLQTVFARESPDYAALANPQPLTVADIQALLADDEALVVIDLGAKSYAWTITRNAADWKELGSDAGQVAKLVATLRSQVRSFTLFDPKLSFELYRQVLGPVEDMIAAKPRWSLVVDGALSSLPPQLLVTRDPTDKALKDVDWLVRSHAVTVLPSVASLKVLRGKSTLEHAPKPLIGFADPVFDRDPRQLQNARVAANVAASLGIRGSVADIAELRTALPPLPETAGELRKVAASVQANPADVILGPDATVTRVKQAKLDQYRIVYFATHGLLAGEVAERAKLNAEPALVLSLPEHPTDFDDGLLTASKAAQLKLNADWVVLSACNTAAGDKPGAEALSGLARAFFYAGGRSLIVSNWEADSDSTVALMVGTFKALADDPKLSHAEALRKSMLAMIGDGQNPDWANPKYWAPFIVVGEPAKPVN